MKLVHKLFNFINLFTIIFCSDDTNSAMNLKRESKAYSYKDQLEELQLRRELEEKKRKEGKIKEPQYTPKQLEAIKNQKSKEQAIRNRLSEVCFRSFYCAF